MDYLTFSQTLKKLEEIPKSKQPQRIFQLSQACIAQKIIPVFQYSAYALVCSHGSGDNARYITVPITGYLTHRNISNVFNWVNEREKSIEFTDAIIYELTKEEKFALQGYFELAKTTFNHLRPIGNNVGSFNFETKARWDTIIYSASCKKDAERIRDLGGVKINQKNLLFPSEQVQDYIDSFIYDDENHINSLVFDSSESDTKISLQTREIAELRSLLNEVNADNKNIKAQLSKYENTSTELKDSAYCLIAVMKDLLLNPDVQARHFKGSNNKPSQTGLAEYITSLKIKDLKTRNINGMFSDSNKLLDIFSDANKLLNEAKKY